MTSKKIDIFRSERGQVGIGTLIVFIAMVLVAAIAAGVLINTAGFLQSKSERTGTQSTAQVTNRVHVISTTGNVTYNSSMDQHVVDYVNLTVMKGSGSGDINLSTATIEWLGPDDGLILVNGSTPDKKNFTIEAIRDNDDTLPVLVNRADRFRIVLNTGKMTDGLQERQEFTLKIVTNAGAVTYHHSIPETLSDSHAIAL
ncbi:archaellin/type IV pilin N-terminal domain-containing protein [Haladaptatus sp. DYF46]|uniref:archaellin/type IV pilin N-terminal domain-containing protein n=1 Tax=Haladaptatus sp. DYF46 TaxID=2886041 RepID=UPI001E4B9F50|nr:archaellin/type IV pilin N-terminal domain-containing protein [Haladaptatus sp. DYF46]